jgi:SAM-dependent methyltransferase
MMHPADGPDFTFVRCGACGLVRLDPRVPAAELGAYYGDDYLPYRGPAAWGRWGPLVARDLAATDAARVETLRRFVDVARDTVVWDVGCGKPTFLEALVRATGCRGIGSDFSDGGWRGEAEGRYRALELHAAEVHPSAAGAAPLTLADFDGPVDAVTMWHYLEHEYRPRETLERVAELARPGATLVVEVPDHDSWTRRRWGAHWAGYHTPRHTALYTPHTLAVLLEASGWDVVHQESRGTLDAYPLHWMSRMERRGIDWRSSMEPRFPGFVVGMLAFRARHLVRRGRGLGIQTAVARRR